MVLVEVAWKNKQDSMHNGSKQADVFLIYPGGKESGEISFMLGFRNLS